MTKKSSNLNAVTENELIFGTVFQGEIRNILNFVCEICHFSDAFISLANQEKQVFLSKIGLSNINQPLEIPFFQEFLNQEENVVFDLKKSSKSFLEFTFFAGFPIVIPEYSFVGSLCILDKEGLQISEFQLKIIEQAATQIQSLMSLNCEKVALENSIAKFQQQQQQQQQVLRIVENISDGIKIIDSQYIILTINEKACEMFGFSKEEILNQSILGKRWNPIHADYTPFLTEDLPISQAIEKLKPVRNVVMGIERIELNDIIWVMVNAIPVFSQDNTLDYVICTFTDITLQKNTENALKESNERFIYANKASFDVIWERNLSTNELFIGPNYTSVFGHEIESDEIEKIKFSNLVHPEDRKAVYESLDTAIAGTSENWFSEYRYLKKDGNYAFVRDRAIIIRDSNDKAQKIIGAMLDITKKKEIIKKNELVLFEINKNKKNELEAAKNQYKILAENTVDLVFLHHLNGDFIYVSPSIKKQLGYHPEDLIGKCPLDFIHPEDAEKFKKNWADFIYDKLNDKLNDKPVIHRFRNSKGDYLWLETKGNVVKVDGKPNSFQSSTRNISERIAAEAKTNDTLIKERELNELRTNLVSTISHEFRTPMTTIRTSAEMIAMYLENQNLKYAPQLQKRIDTIVDEIDRILELMNTVLTISKNDAGKTTFSPIKVDLKSICMDVIDKSFSNQRDGRMVKITENTRDFYILADKNLIEYALFNVLNNAFKYSVGQDDIQLNLFEIHETAVIEITDFGIGIPTQDQSKLFNTFYRASNSHGIQGTGLGLYIVKTFVEKNYGSVSLKSRVGFGTTVRLQFPLLKK